MSMLSEILATKRTEVDCRRRQMPLTELQERLMDAPPVRDFRGALLRARADEEIALIAEVKKASPSKGVIRADFDPIAIARTYADNGAACLSVLTDERYFQGHLDYVQAIHDAVTLPLLRKDFMIDAWQIAESRATGADAILLIVAALTPADLREFLQLARQYDMAALVEVHDGEELTEALDAGADLIGINNRDLHTFRTSLATTLDLLTNAPRQNQGRDILWVSESGIGGHQDVLKLQAAGVGAVLVGESLMREADIGPKVRELLGKA